jgi:hypothetical protein|tara:strand:- start:154 stop:342 length:189 start_codon:yes stop_codon:yes gene_type:complete
MSKSEELLKQRDEIDAKLEVALKEEKAQAITDVKAMIAKFNISKGDLRGATMNILNGKKRKK